ADENTWRQIGQFAADPGESSFIAGKMADTVAVDAGEIDTGEQTPTRNAEATPLAGLPITLSDSTFDMSKPAVASVKAWDALGLSFGMFVLLGTAIVVAMAAAGMAIFS